MVFKTLPGQPAKPWLYKTVNLTTPDYEVLTLMAARNQRSRVQMLSACIYAYLDLEADKERLEVELARRRQENWAAIRAERAPKPE